jgi:hypothetical protein
MSHFSTIKVDVKIDSLNVIESALKQLGYSPVRLQQNQSLNSDYSDQATADLAIPKNQIELNLCADVGFKLNSEGYELVWDTYGVSPAQIEAFRTKLENSIKLSANLTHTHKQVQSLGLNLVSETKQEDGSVRLVVQGGSW